MGQVFCIKKKNIIMSLISNYNLRWYSKIEACKFFKSKGIYKQRKYISQRAREKNRTNQFKMQEKQTANILMIKIEFKAKASTYFSYPF